MLASIDSPATTYRWTTALNGFAADLTAEQVQALETNPRSRPSRPTPCARWPVGSPPPERRRAQLARPRGVEAAAGLGRRHRLRRLRARARLPALRRRARPRHRPRRLLRRVHARRRVDQPRRATARSSARAGGWRASAPTASAPPSASRPSTPIGHGTQVASVAAGNSDVSVRVNGRTMGDFGGVAPRARIAPYKACWAAPDPADDGCASADLVSAIDRATADGVDVLNVAVAGPTSIDTVERALLGAAEADIVVIGAAGNAGRTALAGHTSPWVTTVGATRGSTLTRAGLDRPRSAPDRRQPLAPQPSAPSASCWAPTPPLPARAVETPASADPAHSTPARSPAAPSCACVAASAASTSPRPSPRPTASRWCWPTSGPVAVIDDFHSVPTVQLAQRDGRRLVRWVRTHPRTTVRHRRRPPRARCRPRRGLVRLR